MKAFLLVLLIGYVDPLHGQSFYMASRVALYSGFAADAAGSELALRRAGLREGNPLLGQNPWQRNGVIMGSALATDLLTRKLRGKGHRRAATILNFTLGGFRWGLGVRNARLR